MSSVRVRILEGPYAAVLPKWLSALKKREEVFINGDGETSRDFCYVANVVQANLLAATAQHPDLGCQAFNVARGDRTTLNEIFAAIRTSLQAKDPTLGNPQPTSRDFRAGDIRHSQADISLIQNLLGYEPTPQRQPRPRRGAGLVLGEPIMLRPQCPSLDVREHPLIGSDDPGTCR